MSSLRSSWQQKNAILVFFSVILSGGLFTSLNTHAHYIIWLETFPSEDRLANIAEVLPENLGAEELYARLTDKSVRSTDRMLLFGEVCRRNTSEARTAMERVVRDFANEIGTESMDGEVFSPMALLYLANMESKNDLKVYTKRLEELLPKLGHLEHRFLQYHAAQELRRIGTIESRNVLKSNLSPTRIASDSCSEALAELEIGDFPDTEFFEHFFERVRGRIVSKESTFGEFLLGRKRLEDNIDNEKHYVAALDKALVDPLPAEAEQSQYRLFLQRQMAIVRNMEQQDPVIATLTGISKSGDREKLYNLAHSNELKPYTRRNAYRMLLEVEMREKDVSDEKKPTYLLEKLEGKPIYQSATASVTPSDAKTRQERVTKLLLNTEIMRMIWNLGGDSTPAVEEALRRLEENSDKSLERFESLKELRRMLYDQSASKTRFNSWQAGQGS
jgi:hypothetical protein